ncbi:MAG: hypothetical protein ACI8Y4_001083 [Candidatus Poriferisodalaceae bacterium]|jgi:hypothetical protein
MEQLLLMDRTFTFFGYAIHSAALARGAAVSGAATLGLGIIGRFVDEGTLAAQVISALIIIGFIAGGYVAGRGASTNHVVHGFLSSIPVAVLAIGITIVRVFGDRSDATVLGLVATSVLAGSLGTLGGLLGGRFSPSRRSLLK